MKDKAQLYTSWLAHRRQIRAPKAFSKDVMEAIDLARAPQEKTQKASLPPYLEHPLTQWMAASGLVLLGLFRILYITGSLFRTNLVMP